MATRAEQYRSRQERDGQRRGAHVAKKKPKKSAWSRESAHAAAKATHALEDTSPGARPSRTSTRASANRAKADAPLNKTEEKTKGAPENVARKARARRAKVRGRATVERPRRRTAPATPRRRRAR